MHDRPGRRTRSTSRGNILVLCILAALAANRADAWPKEVHRAIFEAAARLSPEIRSLVPPSYESTFYDALESPDLLDPGCAHHGMLSGNRGPWARAAERAAALLDPAKPPRPITQGRLTGEYLHFVADCFVPAEIRTGENPMVAEFFANDDLVIFREPIDLKGDLTERLRTNGLASSWSAGSSGVNSAVFRAAVNATIDACHRLSAVARRSDGEIPVIFVVNSLDDGRGTTATYKYWATDTYSAGNVVVSVSKKGQLRVGESVALKQDLLHRRGVQVVEWLLTPTQGQVDALLLNNLSQCAGKVELDMGTWRHQIPNELQPQTLTRVRLSGPPLSEADGITARAVVQPCGASAQADGAIPATRRIVVGAVGMTPRFESAAVDDLRAVSSGERR